jgi:hypothetical protein
LISLFLWRNGNDGTASRATAERLPAGGGSAARPSQINEAASPLEPTRRADDAEGRPQLRDIDARDTAVTLSDEDIQTPAPTSNDAAKEPSSPPEREVGARASKSSDGDRDHEWERPLGWCFLTTEHHDIASDSTVVWNGSHSVVVVTDGHGAGDHPNGATGYDTLWQIVDATPYRGKRLMFSAHVRTREPVVVWLWAVAGPGRPATLLGAPGEDVRGSGAGWTEAAAVRVIRDDADLLYYGVTSRGALPLWLDDARIGEVGPETPLSPTEQTGGGLVPLAVGPVLPAPANLDFELQSPPGEAACRVGL